jgi:hypothetical protein
MALRFNRRSLDLQKESIPCQERGLARQVAARNPSITLSRLTRALSRSDPPPMMSDPAERRTARTEVRSGRMNWLLITWARISQISSRPIGKASLRRMWSEALQDLSIPDGKIYSYDSS